MPDPARRRVLAAAALTVTATLTGVGVAARHDDTAPSAAPTPVTTQLGTPSATTATTLPVSPSRRVSRSGDRLPPPVATPEPSPTETGTPSTVPEVSETPELGTATTSTKPTPTPTPSVSVPSPVDESAPDTSASTSAVDGDSWTVAVSADEPASYECSLDGGSYQACGGSTTFTGLERGRHSLTARATDEAGNTDPTPAELTTKVTGSH